jgi:hypothetical protein
VLLQREAADGVPRYDVRLPAPPALTDRHPGQLPVAGTALLHRAVVDGDLPVLLEQRDLPVEQLLEDHRLARPALEPAYRELAGAEDHLAGLDRPDAG